MTISKIKQAILLSLALLIAVLFLASGSFYLYLKLQGKSPEHFVNQGIEFLTQHIPLLGDNKVELTELGSALNILPADSSTYQDLQLAKAPTEIKTSIENYLQAHNPSEVLPTRIIAASFPIVNQGETVETKVFLIPYSLAEDETLMNTIFSSFEEESFELSSETFAGYETYILDQPDGLNYYLCRISTDYLLLTDNKQALAKLLRKQDLTDTLGEKLVFPPAESVFYQSYQQGNPNPDLLQKIARLSDFYPAEKSSLQLSTMENGLVFRKELGIEGKSPESFQVKLSFFSPKESLLYFEDYDLKQFLYPLLESSTGSENSYKLKIKDLVKDFRSNYDLDLEKDLLDWMNRNYSLTVTPVSDPSLFTYAFSLLIELDEKEEALLGLAKAEKAVELYFAGRSDATNKLTYKFIDQNLGDLQLRSIALYPEFGLHYTFLDDNHLLISSHLEGIEDFSEVRPDKDSLATRNALTKAVGELEGKDVLNVFYWDVRQSFPFVDYLLEKYLSEKDAVFLSDLLRELDNIGQISELKSNYIEQTGIINF
ncbi:MAG: DUF3352 domain-containing protein [Candidatus Gracilibacteria bacterium]|nr:DUF3352 domain-containing protein [Candidatus Gracilibacteria bacterium]